MKLFQTLYTVLYMFTRTARFQRIWDTYEPIESCKCFRWTRQNLYICMLYWFIAFPLSMTIYENFLLDNMLLTWLTKLHVIKVERAQTKSSNVAIGYSRNDPSAGYIVQLVGDLD